jgi:hypothetical protein
VRHYGDVGRIEIPLDDFERFEVVRSEASAVVLGAGYEVMELEPKGFKSGGLNAALGELGTRTK